VDLAQAAIGPGMAVYTRYAKVLDAEGKPLSVREALALINQTLDEALAEQEGDFDADSRWALTWFEQSGFAEGEYGVAEQLSKSKNTSVAGMVEAGILESKRGKVRCSTRGAARRLGPGDRPAPHRVGDRAPPDPRARERRRRRGGRLSPNSARPPSSAPRPRNRAANWPTASTRSASARSARPKALAYNGLVQSWPEMPRLATPSTSRRAATTWRRWPSTSTSTIGRSFDKVLQVMSERVPGVSRVEAKPTEDGRLVLRFQDGSFKDPFIARYVSDGTIKMFAYLMLLYDPKPHPLLRSRNPRTSSTPSFCTSWSRSFATTRGVAVRSSSPPTRPSS
jgi:hypothetical protein